jgi:hypothetical protein
VGALNRGDEALGKKSIAYIKKLTRAVGMGAREVLRVHTEQNIVNRGVDMRQLSIRNFLTKPSPLDADGGPPKKRLRIQRNNIPKRPGTDSGSDSDGGGNGGSGMDSKEKKTEISS